MSGGDSLKLLVGDLIYTESPRWHGGALWCSDIGAGKVLRVFPDGRCATVVAGMKTPSGLGWTRAGDLLVASIHDSIVYRVRSDGVPQGFCGPKQHGTVSTNDMATAGSRSYVTCGGRVYRQGDSIEAMSQPVGKIILIDHETGAGRIVSEGLVLPNGIAISPDGRTLFVAESFALRIQKFDILPDGSLGKPRPFIDLGYSPDGICLDVEGGIWVGGTATHKFQRYLASGELAEAVHVPDWGCIACMLGGPDGRSLFMTVSQMSGADDIFEGRAKSRILETHVSVPGSQVDAP